MNGFRAESNDLVVFEYVQSDYNSFNEVISKIENLHDCIYVYLKFTKHGFRWHQPKVCTSNYMFIYEDRDIQIIRGLQATRKQLREGDRVYIPSSVKYPRERIREWMKTQNDIKIVRNIEKATIVVVNLEEIDNICKEFERQSTFKARSSVLTDYPFKSQKVSSMDSYKQIGPQLYKYVTSKQISVEYMEGAEDHTYPNHLWSVGSNTVFYTENELCDEFVSDLGLTYLGPFMARWRRRSRPNLVDQQILQDMYNIRTIYRDISLESIPDIISIPQLEAQINENKLINLESFEHVISLLSSSDVEIKKVGLLFLNEAYKNSPEFLVKSIISLFLFEFVPQSHHRYVWSFHIPHKFKPNANLKGIIFNPFVEWISSQWSGITKTHYTYIGEHSYYDTGLSVVKNYVTFAVLLKYTSPHLLNREYEHRSEMLKVLAHYYKLVAPCTNNYTCVSPADGSIHIDKSKYKSSDGTVSSNIRQANDYVELPRLAIDAVKQELIKEGFIADTNNTEDNGEPMFIDMFIDMRGMEGEDIDYNNNYYNSI